MNARPLTETLEGEEIPTVTVVEVESLEELLAGRSLLELLTLGIVE